MNSSREYQKCLESLIKRSDDCTPSFIWTEMKIFFLFKIQKMKMKFARQFVDTPFDLTKGPDWRCHYPANSGFMCGMKNVIFQRLQIEWQIAHFRTTKYVLKIVYLPDWVLIIWKVCNLLIRRKKNNRFYSPENLQFVTYTLLYWNSRHNIFFSFPISKI